MLLPFPVRLSSCSIIIPDKLIVQLISKQMLAGPLPAQDKRITQIGILLNRL